ncbi:hypothetical protein ACH4S8_27935 [Streptomyces sp. NPDC021080]|uniref:hypothetical protein n=1 Tax=Streptomyces sp. NPDC021080 TaxID=3365110 RepID=UPI0037B97093
MDGPGRIGPGDADGSGSDAAVPWAGPVLDSVSRRGRHGEPVAAGTVARLNGALTPELCAALRAEGPGRKSMAEFAIDDTLDHVPFRDLPLWLKWWKVVSKVLNKPTYRRMLFADAVEAARLALRRRR